MYNNSVAILAEVNKMSLFIRVLICMQCTYLWVHARQADSRRKAGGANFRQEWTEYVISKVLQVESIDKPPLEEQMSAQTWARSTKWMHRCVVGAIVCKHRYDLDIRHYKVWKWRHQGTTQTWQGCAAITSAKLQVAQIV